MCPKVFEEFQEDYEFEKDEINPPYFLKVGEMNIFEKINAY